jgi:hypothetical protein
MTPIGCAATRRAAPELALDVLDGAERAEALHHVARCLADVAELAQVSDQLVGLAPDLEPPPRFAHRVIGQITSRRRHTNWRWAAAITATAATVILVIAATGILTRSAAHPVSAPPLRSVAMLAPGAITVGQVVVSGASPAQMAVNINYAILDGTYPLELVPVGCLNPIRPVTSTLASRWRPRSTLELVGVQHRRRLLIGGCSCVRRGCSLEVTEASPIAT